MKRLAVIMINVKVIHRLEERKTIFTDSSCDSSLMEVHSLNSGSNRTSKFQTSTDNSGLNRSQTELGRSFVPNLNQTTKLSSLSIIRLSSVQPVSNQVQSPYYFVIN